jgi:hypothetical protein
MRILHVWGIIFAAVLNDKPNLPTDINEINIQRVESPSLGIIVVIFGREKGHETLLG